MTYSNEIHVKFADNLTSSRSAKKDIIPLPTQECLRLLEEIMATQLVHYRPRHPADLDDDVVHLGIIAEDAPNEIVNTDRTSLEIGDYCALLMAGIKALKLELDALRATVGPIHSEYQR